jgi:hypothetical protein
MEIVTSTSEFDFKTITLADPQPLAGHAGFYFTQLSTSGAGAGTDTDNINSKSLCLQLPECVSKQGIVDIKNAKYLDLMFDRDTHDELMHWLETLEYTCQDIIDSKKDLWFQTELTRDDIETMMTQIIRLYQSGKYMLMRVFIDVNKGGQKCIAYDENEIGYDIDTLEAGKKMIPLVMIEGVKFSSRSFEISLKLVQVMVIGETEKKSLCLIKRPTEIDNKKVAVAETRTIKKTAIVPASAPAPLENQILLKARPLATKPLLEQQVTTVAAKPSTGQPLGVKPLVQQSIATVAVKPLTGQPLGTKTLAVQPLTAKSSAAKPLTVQPVIKPLASKQPLNAQSLNARPLEKPVQTNIGTLKPIIKKTNTVGIEIRNNLEKVKNAEKKNDIEEITINYEDVSDSICLKNPNEVYYEMYKNARAKAKQCRINSITAYLEAKQIKTKYMLNDLDDDSDDESDDENYIVDSAD